MPQWATFLGITGVVLALLLVLSRLTQSAFSDGDGESTDGVENRPETPSDADRADIAVDVPLREYGSERGEATTDSAGRSISDSNEGVRDTDRDPDESPPRPSSSAPVDDSLSSADRRGRSGDSSRPRNAAATDERPRRPAERGIDPDALSSGAILANVAFSQGLFALLLLGAAVYAAIPASALGIHVSRAYLETGLVWGTVAGVAFYVANELAAAAATRLGFDHEEELRELLAPDSIRGWLVLLLGVLPIIAVFEEFLFRAALIGVPAAAYGVSPWLLAVGSSIAFALGHGMQGSVGVVVTGLLGFALAAVFIVTGSLLVVIVAHYLVNALEFVVHEGVGLEWTETLDG